MKLEKIKEIQTELRKAKIDGWLFTDFHNRDPINYRILELDYGKFTSRRWFYFIPAEGVPKKLVHKVEASKLESLPGEKYTYLSYQQQREMLKLILGTVKTIAMNYSPFNYIPYVSNLEAGLKELIEDCGYKIVSAANLIQRFEAVIDQNGYLLHKKAAELIAKIKDQAFEEIKRAIKEGRKLTESQLQHFIINRFEEEGLDCENEYPIVGINEHPTDPHFEPSPEHDYYFKKGDTVLIDLWAKLKEKGAIYADITWCGYIGDKPPEEYQQIFDIVIKARDTAVNFIREKFERNEKVYGWEVDRVCRRVIEEKGYGEYFIHRTGHNIGEKVHGNGVNIDSLETRDERELIPGICFSIEPGIYLPGKFAVRSEIDLFITYDNKVEITTPVQTEIVKID